MCMYTITLLHTNTQSTYTFTCNILNFVITCKLHVKKKTFLFGKANGKTKITTKSFIK